MNINNAKDPARIANIWILVKVVNHEAELELANSLVDTKQAKVFTVNLVVCSNVQLFELMTFEDHHRALYEYTKDLIWASLSPLEETEIVLIWLRKFQETRWSQIDFIKSAL